MAQYHILARTPATACALGAYLPLLGEKGLQGGDDPRCIVWTGRHAIGTGALPAFDALFSALTTHDTTGDPHLSQRVVMVDSVRPDQLNAIAVMEEWDSLLAMLILSLPDVLWVFGVLEGPVEEEWKAVLSEHSLSRLLIGPRRDPLFDPTGLRNLVRTLTNRELSYIDDMRVPVRTAVAAAIDEESSFAYLHAYTAYRFGFRGDAIISWRLMRDRFSQARHHGYTVLLEDMSLNLADRPEEREFHLLDLNERAQQLPALNSIAPLSDVEPPPERSSYRVLVTTGQTSPADEALRDNQRYLDGKAVGIGTVVLKPAAGIFDLWRRARIPGYGPKFDWPPPAPETPYSRHGHGAPGKLLAISDALISRASAYVERIRGIREAVLGAVLATDAQEIIGDRTPTSAVNALRLKHHFEVEAECLFAGMSQHLDLAPRLGEIDAECARIADWFAAQKRTEARLNATLGVVHSIVAVLREHNRFDEEQRCLRRIRTLHRQLWVRQHWSHQLLRPLLWYLATLLGSFGTFVAVILGWVAALTVAFGITGGCTGHLWTAGFADATSAFFAAGPPMDHPHGIVCPEKSGWYVSCVCIAIVSGFLHLGVFVSHLYTLVARR